MKHENFVLARAMIRVLLISGLTMILLLQIVQASGACCTVSLSERNKPAVTLIASTGWSHEQIAGTMYDLRQHALIGKGMIPLGENLFLTAQLGVPLRTELIAKSDALKGSMGYLFGIGVGSVLPQLLPSTNLYGSVSYARSVGNLDQANSGREIDASFVISEVQGILLAEYEITSETSFYGGARFYSGRNRIHNETKNLTLSGEREGSVSPLFGIRHAVWEGVSLVGEGSIGHTRIVSFAMAVSL